MKINIKHFKINKGSRKSENQIATSNSSKNNKNFNEFDELLGIHDNK